MDEIPLEASPEDVADQRTEVAPLAIDDDATPVAGATAVATRAVPWDADPADFAEQQAEVPLDDDDRA